MYTGGNEETVWAVPGVDLPRPAPSLRPELAQLEVLVDALSAGQISGRDGLAETAELVRLAQRLHVLSVTRLDEVAAQQLHALDGRGSAYAWARDINPDLDRRDLTAAQRIRRWPLLGDAVRAGLGLTAGGKVAAALDTARPHLDQPDGMLDGVDGLRLDGAAVLAAVAGNTVDLVAGSRLGLADDDPLLVSLLEQTEHIAEGRWLPPGALLAVPLTTQAEQLEAALVLLAQHVPAALLHTCLAQQLDAVLPQLLEEASERAEADRGLIISRRPRGAGMRITIDTDIETGELAYTCLRDAAHHDPTNPTDTATAAALREQGLDPHDPTMVPPSEAPRSRGVRLHDAFRAILQAYLSHAGSSEQQPVRITVTLPSTVLDSAPGTLPALGGSGRSIPRQLLRRWWCDSEITTLVLSTGHRALGDTHTARTVTGRERRALTTQTLGLCARDGCCRPDDPLRRLVPHHVHGYAQHGRTSLSETIMVCDALHHDLHHGHTIRLRDGRWLTAAGWTDAPSEGRPSDQPFPTRVTVP